MNPIANFKIDSIAPIGNLSQAKVGGVDGTKDDSFKNYLLESIQEVNSMQQKADQAVEDLMVGGDANPGEVLTAVQKADIAFKMMMQIRNKLVDAYNEVQNIRV